MVYPGVTFPIIKTRPYFYTNFVTTIDGKIQVLTKNKNAYWPIGSKTDYQTLVEIRGFSDTLIHGYNTAMAHRTVDSLGKEKFKKLRSSFGKKNDLLYIVMTKHKTLELKKQLKNSQGVKTLVTNSSIPQLASFLHKQGYKHILVEGGPHVLGSFFKHNLVDEIFLTIAPKLFGSKNNVTLTMVEGYLFSPLKVKKWSIVSVKQIQNELYIRYRTST